MAERTVERLYERIAQSVLYLPVDLSMRAECMHENKNEVTGNLLLGCTVLRITPEFPGAVTI